MALTYSPHQNLELEGIEWETETNNLKASFDLALFLNRCSLSHFYINDNDVNLEHRLFAR